MDQMQLSAELLEQWQGPFDCLQGSCGKIDWNQDISNSESAVCFAMRLFGNYWLLLL